MGEGELGESNCMDEGMCPTCGMRPCGCPMMEEEAKPDFLDLDKDGNKEEPMKDAAASAKKMSESQIRSLVREALKRTLAK